MRLYGPVKTEHGTTGQTDRHKLLLTLGGLEDWMEPSWLTHGAAPTSVSPVHNTLDFEILTTGITSVTLPPEMPSNRCSTEPSPGTTPADPAAFVTYQRNLTSGRTSQGLSDEVYPALHSAGVLIWRNRGTVHGKERQILECQTPFASNTFRTLPVPRPVALFRSRQHARAVAVFAAPAA
jgi:hypothetical protein